MAIDYRHFNIDITEYLDLTFKKLALLKQYFISRLWPWFISICCLLIHWKKSWSGMAVVAGSHYSTHYFANTSHSGLKFIHITSIITLYLNTSLWIWTLYLIVSSAYCGVGLDNHLLISGLILATFLLLFSIIDSLFSREGWFLVDLKQVSDTAKYFGKIIFYFISIFLSSSRKTQVLSSCSPGKHWVFPHQDQWYYYKVYVITNHNRKVLYNIGVCQVFST